MAPQADGLLVHSHLIRVDGGLHQDPLLVDGGALQHLLHPGGELGAVLRHRLRRPHLHLSGVALNGVQPVGDVLRQLLPLYGPHVIVRGQRLVQDRAEVGADSLQVLIRLRDGEDVREPGQRLRRGPIVRCAADVRQLPQGGGILGRQLPVHRNLDHIRGSGVHGDEHVHLSPGHRLLDVLFHCVLRKGIHPGHLHGAVQIPVVDGADLHRDVPLVQLLSCPAVAGHALNHVIPTSSLVVSQQQNQ